MDEKAIVFNAGRGGLRALNHIYFLGNYKWIDEFDWVVIMAGVNDMGRLLHDAYQYRTIYGFDDALVYMQRGNLVYYKDSVVIQKIVFLYKNIFSHEIVIRDLEGRWYERKREMRRLLLKRNPVDEIPQDIHQAIEIYKDNLREMTDLCRQRGQGVLMLTQPTMYKKNLPEELEDLIWEHVGRLKAYTTSTLEMIINIYNEAMIEVCREEGVPYIDMASLLPKDTTVFYDDCHFNISGCEKVAAILTEYFYDIYAKKYN
jgi:lysophospholipase L1-like esterase